MDHGIDNLSDLFVFVRVVDAGSFTAASTQLGVTKSAVSKQVARLERSLGAKLLHRTTRRLSPTEIGAAVYTRGARIAEEAAEMATMVDQLQTQPRGTLRIATSTAFGNLHFTKLMAGFTRAHPQIGVALVLSDRYVDMVEEGIDLAVRLTSKPPDNVVARRLAGIEYVLCASAAYLKEHGVPATPEALAQHACLTYALRGDPTAWRLSANGIACEVTVSSRFAVNSSESLRVAALEDLGIALLPTFAVRQDLADGRLVAVLPEFQAHGNFGEDIYAIYPSARFLAPKVRLLVDYLVGAFAGAAAWER